ncbi:MAG: hypothetical protein HY901_23165 [Deltaproteobacteria bacterium]|nr:hypothetical protein [Deltaproteobacteria bacterium]
MERVVEGGSVLAGRAPVFRWGAVFAGAVVAMGVWILLYAFGLAIGLNSLDMRNPRSVGTWTGVWSLVAPLIALFVGGLVAARVAGPVDRTVGALHGAVVWGLSTIAGLLIVGMVLSRVVGGLASAGGSALAGIGGTGGGLSAEQLLGPVNQKLQAEGKATVTANQLEATIRSMGSTVITGGTLDQEAFARALSQNTNLSRQDAREIANQAQQQLSAATQGLQQGAIRAANISGMAFWGVFIALALGLVSAVLGAAAGVSRRQVVEVASV